MGEEYDKLSDEEKNQTSIRTSTRQAMKDEATTQQENNQQNKWKLVEVNEAAKSAKVNNPHRVNSVATPCQACMAL